MNIYNDAISLFRGFGKGHAMHAHEKRRETVAQGQNYVLIIPDQLGLIGIALDDLVRVAYKILELYPAGRLASTSLSILSSTPANLGIMATIIFAGYHRDNQYGTLVEQINECLPNSLQMKKEVSPLVGRIFIFISENAHKFSHVVMLTTTAAKFAIGYEKEAIAALTIMGIGFLDRNGFLHERVSIFFNDNLSIISTISIIIFSSPLQKLIGVTQLVLSNSTGMQKLSYLIDNQTSKFFTSGGLSYPSLQYFNEKYQESESLRFTAEEILNFDQTISSRINPVHLQRKIASLPSNPDAKFETLNTLFDTIGFTGEALTRLVKKIQGDDRFLKVFLTESKEMQMLLTNCLTVQGKQLWQDVLNSGEKFEFKTLHPIFKELTDNGKVSWEKALFDYAKDQMNLFVDNISGKKTPKGDQNAIIKARKSCKVVISYLENQLKKFEDPNSSEEDKRLAKLDIQSHLSTLLVEGGDYCVQGIIDAIRECYNRILKAKGGNNTIEGHFDVMAQNAREYLFEEMYARHLNQKGVKWAPKEDRHFFNAYKRIYGQGLGLDMSSAEGEYAPELGSMLVPTLFPFFRKAFWNSDLSKGAIENTYQNCSFRFDEIDDKWKKSGTIEKITTLVPAYIKNYVVFLSFLAVSEFNEAMSFAYNEQNLIEGAKALIGTDITIQQYTKWWKDYIAKLCNGNAEQIQIMEYCLLDDPYGEDMVMLLEDVDLQNFRPGIDDPSLLTKQTVNEKFLKIMLIEMGFLQKPAAQIDLSVSQPIDTNNESDLSHSLEII